MKKKKEAHKLLLTLADSLLTPEGYVRNSQRIVVKENSRFNWSLSFPFRFTMNTIGFFNIIAGIQIPDLNSQFYAEETKFVPHIIVPFHFLDPGRHFKEWQFQTEGDLWGLTEDICLAIEQIDLKFFNPLSTTTKIISQLSKTDPGEWFAIDPIQRGKLLACLLFMNGDGKRAVQILDSTLRRFAQLSNHRLQELQVLREKISSSST